jgi:ribulose-phosphate 3-epimerase
VDISTTPGRAAPTESNTLSASVMCADFRQLEAQLEALKRAGVHRAHLDFGDGRFVPNLPLGMEVFSQLPPRADWVRECHLMVEAPQALLHLFAPQSDMVIFHLEANVDAVGFAATIRQTGCKVGIALNPGTPPDEIVPLVDLVDEILVMAVTPGFAGGGFIPEIVEKVRQIRALADRARPGLVIEVDGAVSARTIPVLVEAGADRFVGGTSGLFVGQDLEVSARALIGCIELSKAQTARRHSAGLG